MYQREVCKHLEAIDLMRFETKYQKNLEAQQTVLEQMKLEKNNALSNGGPLNLDGCGPSSIQIFAGEDQDYSIRKKHQQQQVSLIIYTTLKLFVYMVILYFDCFSNFEIDKGLVC